MGKHYNSFNDLMIDTFGCKVYKLALDGGFTCPNRDGSCGSRGCIFCAGGSGDFSIPTGAGVYDAIENAKALVASKNKGGKYIAYFQSFTGTYAPVERLRSIYTEAINHPDIVALDIGTRPDCLGDDILELLAELNRIKPVWIELGLQTIHQKTAEYIRRGYSLDVYDKAVKALKSRGIYTVAHMILGLPGESPEMIYETAEYIGKSGVDGIKLQLLHVLKGTDLADEFNSGMINILSLDEYIKILEGCIKRIPQGMTVHRLTGDGSKRDLIAPLWSGNKKAVLNQINMAFDRDNIRQGEQAE